MILRAMESGREIGEEGQMEVGLKKRLEICERVKWELRGCMAYREHVARDVRWE